MTKLNLIKIEYSSFGQIKSKIVSIQFKRNFFLFLKRPHQIINFEALLYSNRSLKLINGIPMDCKRVVIDANEIISYTNKLRISW